MSDRPVVGAAFDADVRGQSVEMKALDAGSVNTDAWEWDLETSPGAPVMRLRSPYVLDIGQYVSVSTTPYTMPSTGRLRVFLCTTGASNLVFNLAAASALLEKGPFLVLKVDSGAGAVQVAPNGTDALSGGVGNVSVYLGQRGNYVLLMATAAGLLALVDGVYQPAHGVDTNGADYDFGRLHRLPLNSTTSRLVVNSVTLPTAGNWSSAYTATGSFGVPVGALAIRARAMPSGYATAAGLTQLVIGFSNNNTYAPATGTAHPLVLRNNYAGAAGYQVGFSAELDIPLNSSGQLYFYTVSSTNITIASSTLTVTVLGYYMGV